MADNDDFDIDPAIAEAMGFAGFGMQPGKKRKFDANDGFVDPDAKQEPKTAEAQSKGKGANYTPLGSKAAQEMTGDDGSASLTASGGGASAALAQSSIAVSTHQQLPRRGPLQGERGGRIDLQALRHGVKNENGDVAYFLPSFIEDPWEGLRPQ